MVPASRCSGVIEDPLIAPVGARAGRSNGDRSPNADVGGPGLAVGSAGTLLESGAAAGACPCGAVPCPAMGTAASTAPPADAAAAASNPRRVILGAGASEPLSAEALPAEASSPPRTLELSWSILLREKPGREYRPPRPDRNRIRCSQPCHSERPRSGVVDAGCHSERASAGCPLAGR